MRGKQLIFMLTLALCLSSSIPCWSIGERPWSFQCEQKENAPHLSVTQTTEENRRNAEMDERCIDMTSEADAEMDDVNDTRDLSLLTINCFKTALEIFPNAERFVLKRTPDGSIIMIPEDADFTDPSKVILENKIILQAFQSVLQTEFHEIDLSSFFENENLTSFPPLGTGKIKEILNYCERIEQISQKRDLFLAPHSLMTSSFSLQKEQEEVLSAQSKKENFRKRNSWSWKSAILPTITFFLSDISSAAAQPFAHCAPLCYPNGTKMGLSWENKPNFFKNNASQHQFNLTPLPCILAERLYDQAQHAADKGSEACFQNLEHPKATLQKQWEDIFLQSIPLKENWMASEALCHEALNHLSNFKLPSDWFLEATNSSQHRQEEWVDAARWYPSSYTAEFQKDLHEYSHACVIDAAEKEGPEAGQRTRSIIARGVDQFPYTRLESLFNVSTGDLLKQSAMGANHLLVTLKKEEDPEVFRKKLEYLDPTITIKKDSPYRPNYLLEFKKISLQFLPKILAACRALAVRCNVNSYGQSTVITSPSSFFPHNSKLSEPNDAKYADQTNLKLIQASQAWDSRSSAPNHITIVIDSGIHPHEDLKENMWNNPKLFHAYEPDEYQHGFVADPSFNITPTDNHGTHCGGILAAVGNNSLGIAGIVWDASLMFCKATSLRNNKTIDWQDRHVAKCIDHALYNNVSVISASYRDLTPTPETLEILTEARDKGIIVVTSADNDAKNLDHHSVYPASYAKSPCNPTGLDNILVVGAVDDHDQWWPSSNYGPGTVHLAAPGVNVLSTVLLGNISSYERKSGTSMAVPHVAGALALMKEQFPGKPHTWLIEKLLNATDRIPSLTNKTIYGRLNIAKALESDNKTCPVLELIL